MTQPVPNALFGHPRGLMTLFFVEMWERFSFYGMKALLILYMTAPVDKGGLGFTAAQGGPVIAWYGFFVYALGVPGGYVADRWLGYRKAVLIGGLILAAGHFALAFPGVSYFYGGLALVAIGTGLLKTNATSMVGMLYDPKETGRRDAGYTIYYLGINIGGMVGPLVTGFFAQTDTFRNWLVSVGMSPNAGWHFAFGAAGVSMLLGLAQYLAFQKRAFGSIGVEPRGRTTSAGPRQPLTRDEWHRVGVIVILIVFATIFWATFEQTSTTLNLFADRMTDTSLLGIDFPSSYFQSVNSFFILALGTGFAVMWTKLGRHNPTAPVKFAIGLFLVGLGFAILIPPANAFAATALRVSPMWLIGTYLIHTIGELSLSPNGQSLVSRISPARIQGSMMGWWFMSLAFGNLIAGYVGGLFETVSLATIFGIIFIINTVATVVVLALKPLLNRWAGDTAPRSAH